MPVSNSYNSLSRGSAMISDSRDCSRFLEKKALWVARRDSRRIVGQPETEIRMPANFRVARDPFGMIGERESTMTRGRCDSLGLHRTALASAPPRRFIPAPLFVSQSDHWIYLRRAARGDVAGQHCNQRKRCGNDQVRERIGSTDSDKIADDVSSRESSCQADGQARTNDDDSLSQDHSQDILRMCTQRHTDANLVGSLAGDIGNDPVNANGGKNDPEYSEGSSKRGSDFKNQESG